MGTSKKPDGQLKRQLDTTKSKKFFNFEAKLFFDVGLKRTIDWYINTEIVS